MRLSRGGTPEDELWVKKASQVGKHGVSNVNGEADTQDSELSAFQRMEKSI